MNYLQFKDMFSKIKKYSLLAFLHSMRVFAFLTMLMPVVLLGQTHSERVTVVGSFQPSLQEFQKINLKPEAPTSGIEAFKPKFTKVENVLFTKSDAELISPLAVQIREKKNTFHNYVRAGLGSNISPIFLFQHHSELGKQTSFDLGIQHLSSWTNVQDYAPSDWMKNTFSAGLNHSFSNHTLRTNLYYKRNHNRYYGFKPGDFPNDNFTKDSIAQHYQNIGIETVLNSNYKDFYALHHKAAIRFNTFRDRFKASEQSFEINAELRKNFELFRYSGTQTIGLDIDNGFYSNKDSISGYKDFRLGLLPGLKLTGSFYELSAGFRFEFMNDSSTHLFAYPMLSGKLFMFDEKVELFAKMDGQIERNSLSQITEINPFLRSAEMAWWSNSRFIFETGIKTGVIKNLDLHLGLRYEETDHAGFFITDTSTVFQNTLTVAFDNIKKLRFSGEASYKLTNKINIGTRLLFDQYTMDSLTKAWHMPGFQMHFIAGYQFDEKLRLKAELMFQDKRYAPSYVNGIENLVALKPVTDINLGAEYAINEQFTVFAQVNNLLHNRYERYYMYPVQGIQLFAGMSLRF